MVRRVIHDPEIRKQFVPREPAIKAGALPGTEIRVIKQETGEQEKVKTGR